MSGPAPPRITVTVRQRRVLEQIIRRETSTQQQMRRATVILAAVSRANNEEAARQAGVKRDTVRLWRRRWGAVGEALLAAEADGDDAALLRMVLGLLADGPRPGAPATFRPEQICQIIALACEPPERSARPISQWTLRDLAQEAIHRGIVATISSRSVGRFLKGGGVAAAPEPVLADARAR